MANKRYCQMYRELKHSYERTYQKPISDISWYRLISQLRQFLDFSVESANASLIIKSIANLKRTHRNFRISSEGFNESWEIFQHYYQQQSSLTCAEFLSEISQIVDLSQVSKTSIYNWFVKRVFEKFLGVKFYASRRTMMRIIAR
ncbi:hypothetical protein LC612_37570 [Nostoc sp. CHAB 5834]|nr:hypothetical protein [Nostoc sp. CHAB 5834]